MAVAIVVVVIIIAVAAYAIARVNATPAGSQDKGACTRPAAAAHARTSERYI